MSNKTIFTMRTLEDLTSGITITEKEAQVLNFLYEALSSWIGGEDYSDVDVEDITEGTKLTKTTVKGVVGSLVKKDILTSYDTGTGYDVILFVNQGDDIEYVEGMTISVSTEIPQKETQKEDTDFLAKVVRSNTTYTLKQGRDNWLLFTREVKKGNNTSIKADISINTSTKEVHCNRTGNNCKSVKNYMENIMRLEKIFDVNDLLSSHYLTEQSTFTELEQKVLDTLKEYGEDYNEAHTLHPDDLSENSGIVPEKLRGVISSLSKKEAIEISEYPNESTCIMLHWDKA